MTLQQLFASTEIDFKRVKLVRHNITNAMVSKCMELGYLELYQTIQSPTRFKDTDYVISFLGETGTNGTYLGCYKVEGCKPFDRSAFPDNFPSDCGAESDIVYDLVKTDYFSELVNRLIIDWGKGTLNWCHNGSTEKEILSILPPVSNHPFPGYNKVILSYAELQDIIYNPSAHAIWNQKLSAVAGVYLITDTKTGMHYVGSAYGDQGGIWGRWSSYAHTKHGGNKELIDIISKDPGHAQYFQYSILEVLPLKTDKHEVLYFEKLNKIKLRSIEFGLNDN